MIQKRRRAPLLALLLGIPALLSGSSLPAGDLTVFVSTANPTPDWGRGFGAALSTTWFEVLSFEGEIERLGGDPQGPWAALNMTSFTASALLAPPIGRLTPYGGLGLGVFRQANDPDSDTGRLRAFILGTKLTLGVLVLRIDYRRVDLSGEPLLGLETRLAAGAGISF